MSLLGRVRAFARSNLLRLGVDARLTETALKDRKAAYLRNWLPLLRSAPRVVIDIGANIGQFATLMRELSPGIELICIEPLDECQSRLKHALANLGGATTLHHCAVGMNAGMALINRNEHTDSSSFLPLGEMHRQEWPFASHTTGELVRVVRMDDLIDARNLPRPYIVKMDVQGFELSVIESGPRTLTSSAAAIIECSSHQLYNGQATFDDINTAMKSLGFVFRGILDQCVSTKDLQIMQFDALFESTRL